MALIKRMYFRRTKTQGASTHLLLMHIHINIHTYAYDLCSLKWSTSIVCGKACLNRKILSWALNSDRVGRFRRLAAIPDRWSDETESSLTDKIQITCKDFQKPMTELLSRAR